MVKKAYIVTFTTSTRVVVDVSEDFDPHNCNLVISEHEKAWESIVEEAIENILENPCNYLYEGDAEINEDTECPYEEP